MVLKGVGEVGCPEELLLAAPHFLWNASSMRQQLGGWAACLPAYVQGQGLSLRRSGSVAYFVAGLGVVAERTRGVGAANLDARWVLPDCYGGDSSAAQASCGVMDLAESPAWSSLAGDAAGATNLEPLTAATASMMDR